MVEKNASLLVYLVSKSISEYSQVPNKRVYLLNYCNVELLSLTRAKSSTLQYLSKYTRLLGTWEYGGFFCLVHEKLKVGWQKIPKKLSDHVTQL